MGVKHDDEKSPKHNLGEEMKTFWQGLFLLNAKIDIIIDEEEPPEKVDEIIIDGISNHLQFPEPISIEVLKSLIYEAKEVLNDSDSIREGAAKLQNVWHDVWENYTNKKIVKTPIGLGGSVSLLLLGKFCRSLYLSLSQKQTGKTTIDFLSHFLAANVNVSIDKDNALRPIQVLLYMECAACAPPEASLGFLKMAEAVTRNTEIQALFPAYRALRNYNKAVALNHLFKRNEALEAISIAFDEIERNKEELEQALPNWVPYLYSPILLVWADILQKMQFGKNSIDIIEQIGVVGGADNKLSLYKTAKKHIYEALAWLDVGHHERAQDVIKALLSDERNITTLFGDNISLLLKSVIDDKGVPSEVNRDELVAELRDQQRLKLDVISFCIQYIISSNGSLLDKTENVLPKIESLLNLLERMIFHYREDRFIRHNLKEFAIECLDHIEKVAKLHLKNEGWKTLFTKYPWTQRLEQCLKCIDSPSAESEEKEQERYEFEGSIANEFWGRPFKKLLPGLRNRVFDITSDLVNMFVSNRIKECKSYNNDNGKHHCKNNGECVEKNTKDILKKLVEFELNALGLKKIMDSYDVTYQGTDTHGKGNEREDHDYVYPRKGSYWDRRILRRGFYLAHVQRELLDKNPGENVVKNPGENDDGCPTKLRDEFTWLEKELESEDDKKILGYLTNAMQSWKNTTSEQQRPHGLQKMHRLEMDDYESIVRERDYLARLEAGRTEHPVAIFKIEGKWVGGIEFVALRRWNSFTPELTFSRGGGYFVFVPDDGTKKRPYGGTYRKTKFGVVIDPGFDFIHNFFTQGFALDDIDIVLLTHAHHDHIDDFQGIADLLMESSKRGNRTKPKKIYAFMPLDTYSLVKRFIHEHAYRRFYNDTVIVDMNRLLPDGQRSKLNQYDLVEDTEGKLRFSTDDADKKTGHCINIQPVMASHNDYVTPDPCCVGYVLKFMKEGSPIASLGFTGDSQWFPEYAKHFQDCELVCSHMGSVLGDDNPEEYKREKISHGAWESLIREKNHPYLPGEILFLEQLRKQWSSEESVNSDKVDLDRVVVLSEFGEEMKGLMRVDLAHRFNACMSKGKWDRFGDPDNPNKPTKHDSSTPGCEVESEANKSNSMYVEPADIGLRIAVHKEQFPLVHCAICDDYVELKRLEIEAYGHEEALFFVCGPCFRSRTHDVRSKKYESILEFGRVLRQVPDPDDTDNKKDNKESGTPSNDTSAK